MKTNLQFFKKLAIVFICIIPITALGQIQINNETELKAIANNLTGDYKLVNDITLTEVWTPIGNENNRFRGTIDGNGKTIFGLKTTDSSKDRVGFIGVSEGAVIQNLKIEGAQIEGKQDVGAIIGLAYAPTKIEQCYTSGSITGKDHVGGLVGGTKQSSSNEDMSTIENCFSAAIVISTSWQAGGIIGTTVNCSVSNTYFAGTAGCPSGRTGGIVALADGGKTKIEKSVSLTPFLMGDEANRIIGSKNDKTVDLFNNYSRETTKIYVKGNLYEDGESDPNGVDGEHKDDATLKSTNFYTTTLAWNSTIWKIQEGKYPIFADQTYPLNGDAIYINKLPERAIPGNTHETKVASALGRTVSCTSSNPAVATINATGLVSFLANGNTTLTFTTDGDDYSDGTTLSYDLAVEGISYNIKTEDDLRNIKYDLEGEFTLMNDITLTKNWTPIGKFRGKLNGNGKVISGLKVDERNSRNKGLFSETEGAEITKLGIENAHVVGNEDVGAFVGAMRGGLIDQCYVSNSYVEGRDHVGAFVGAMYSYQVVIPENPTTGTAENKEKRFATISNSHAGGKVYSREFQAGGIAGIIAGGTIEKCYFSGLVESVKGRACGIVSLIDNNDPGEIKNNINLAAAGYCSEATYRIGDWGSRGPESNNYVVKFTNNWSKENSFFGKDAKNSATQEGQKDDNRNGANLTDDNNARKQSFYTGTLGWDFTNTWKFVSGTEGKLYPVLAWQNTPLSSEIYGIPKLPYLTWYPNSLDAIELNKIIPTTGETLTFKVISGGNLVELEGLYLYVTQASTLTEGGVATVEISADANFASIVKRDNVKFDIDVVLRDAYNDISSVEEFLNINNRLFAKFRLTKSLDLSGVEFEGFGSSSVPFTGEFEGNGFTVNNVTITTKGNNVKGFFNATDGATIKRLGVKDIKFTGVSTGKGNDIGGLVGGCRNTTIEECFVTGEITGHDHVGGFVGGRSENVTIRNSYADVIIDAGQQAGGFFGVTEGSVTIENSYYAGSINAKSRGWAGGIIGLIDRSGEIKVSGCVSIGNLSSVEVAGYHIGGNIKDNDVERGNVSLFLNNLYNSDAVLTTNNNQWVLSEVVSGSKEEATSMSSDNLKKQATYTAIGWDFNEIWTIEEGTTYPQLKFKETPSNIPEQKILKNKAVAHYTLDNNIYLLGLEREAELTVYSITGQIIFQSVVTNNKAIPVPSKGVYLLRITENGLTSFTKVLCK